MQKEEGLIPRLSKYGWRGEPGFSHMSMLPSSYSRSQALQWRCAFKNVWEIFFCIWEQPGSLLVWAWARPSSNPLCGEHALILAMSTKIGKYKAC